MSRALASCGRPPMKKSWLQLSNLGDTRCAPCEIVQIGYVRMKNGTSLAFRLQLGRECVRASPPLTEPAAPRLAQADRVPAHTFNAARSQVGPH